LNSLALLTRANKAVVTRTFIIAINDKESLGTLEDRENDAINDMKEPLGQLIA
jgi:hypothetical protein